MCDELQCTKMLKLISIIFCHGWSAYEDWWLGLQVEAISFNLLSDLPDPPPEIVRLAWSVPKSHLITSTSFYALFACILLKRIKTYHYYIIYKHTKFNLKFIAGEMTKIIFYDLVFFSLSGVRLSLKFC